MKQISNSIGGLFDHVKEAILAVVQSQTDRGRAVIPTGGGKTAVEAHSLRLRGLSKDFKVHLVLAPRIALTNQLIKEYRSYIGHGYLAMAFPKAAVKCTRLLPVIQNK